MKYFLNIVRRIFGTTSILNKLCEIENDLVKSKGSVFPVDKLFLSDSMVEVRKVISDNFIKGGSGDWGLCIPFAGAEFGAGAIC